MGREANIHLIGALEKQIEEGDGDIIKLKRTRNSLLNIFTRAPPEVLGRVFVWSVARDTRDRSLFPRSQMAGLQKGSYNFVLVCHHWFEVASRTPELWSFWGNTLKDWKNRHHLSGDAPVDLVLYRVGDGPHVPFDECLQDAVRRRVVQNTIRQVHLSPSDLDSGTIASIISSLTPDDEGAQNENIESITWDYIGSTFLDISNFLARSHLSRLRWLSLNGSLQISSWTFLTLRTTLLTALELGAFGSPTLTTSQLVSILTSNPNLRQLMLSGVVLPNDADESTYQVPLRHLEMLCLRGVLRRIFGLLHRLVLPEMLDSINLVGSDFTVDEVSELLIPYMRDYFRRDPRFQDRLEIGSDWGSWCVAIMVNPTNAQATTITRKSPSADIVLVIPGLLPDASEQLFTNLVAVTPHEHIVSIGISIGIIKLSEELCLMMPNVETLTLHNVKLAEGFLQPNPDGPNANTKLLPSLQLLRLKGVTLENDDWSPLTAYLTHQTSGGQAISLALHHPFPPLCPEVVEEVEALVKKFDRYGRLPLPSFVVAKEG